MVLATMQTNGAVEVAEVATNLCTEPLKVYHMEAEVAQGAAVKVGGGADVVVGEEGIISFCFPTLVRSVTK